MERFDSSIPYLIFDTSLRKYNMTIEIKKKIDELEIGTEFKFGIFGVKYTKVSLGHYDCPERILNACACVCKTPNGKDNFIVVNKNESVIIEVNTVALYTIKSGEKFKFLHKDTIYTKCNERNSASTYILDDSVRVSWEWESTQVIPVT